MKRVAIGFATGLALVLGACDGTPMETGYDASSIPLAAKGGNGGGGHGGGGGGGGTSLTISMTGDFSGAAQAISGKNDSRTLSAKGDYTLTMSLDLENLVCGDLPGSIPDESGLVAFVQGQTPRVGSLDINYDKAGPDAGRVDSWTTAIGANNYKVQIFRWDSATIDENGATTVRYRGGSIEVFKMKGKKYLSREQCFGSFVDYDLTAE